MRVDVVIGAAYGDEGKGHVASCLASPESIVVRFNGGCQAGHTVYSKSGVRRVFSHFGSGTMTGARTYLSKHFVCNPILFLAELKDLIPFKPNVSV
jgi:adenylosuccinate synthase